MALGRHNMEFQLDVYSDVICPWCYVGMKRLEAALELLGRPSEVSIMWRPFELNPTMPAFGMDRKTYLETKFGNSGAVESMLDHVRQAGRQAGIAFAFDRIKKTPNTFEAHRLIWLAGREGRQGEVVERLFRGYFEEGMDLSDRSALAQAASEAGIRQDNVAAWLDSTEGVDEVRAEEQRGLHLGIRGVPYFVVDGRLGLSGAQPPAVIAAWLREASVATVRSTR
ncbi:MAG TPA: DsbA family oxidoreductase [Nitrospiraceae bacterium]|nr:DsbA family oxidoreductase [Nitrospiraceae bacterium]